MPQSDRADALRGRRAALDMTGEEFRAAGHALIDDIADFLDGLRTRAVNRDLVPADVQAMLPQGGCPLHPTDAVTLLRETAALMFDQSLHNGHPRFFGYITSSAAPLGALGDMLAAAVNPNAGGWQLSPVASEIERQSLAWIAELIGYPTDSGGLFVSGGNVANFVGFLAARRQRADWPVREQGLARGQPLTVYGTNETHTWIQKATDLFGLGTAAIREIPVDRELRARPEALAKLIERDRRRGARPFLVVASAGTVSTGAIDPIRAMAKIARESGLWLHVDGAYGAPAAMLPDAPDELKALGEADSVATDPHKWLYAPLEAGCVLVRNPQHLIDAFAYRPRYYHFDEEAGETNFYELGLQNSRCFRALKVWLTLRQVGREGFARMIADDIALARRMHAVLDAAPEIQARDCNLSIVTFRYVPPGYHGDEDYLDKLNEAILARMKRSGEAFFSNAVIDGRFLLRGCIVNFRTSLEDIEALPEIVTRHGRAVNAEMRGAP